MFLRKSISVNTISEVRLSLACPVFSASHAALIASSFAGKPEQCCLVYTFFRFILSYAYLLFLICFLVIWSYSIALVHPKSDVGDLNQTSWMISIGCISIILCRKNGTYIIQV